MAAKFKFVSFLKYYVKYWKWTYYR